MSKEEEFRQYRRDFVSKREQKDHSFIGGGLVLTGGILALIFPIFPLALTFLLRGFVVELFETIVVLLGGRSVTLPHLAEGILMFVAIGALVTIILGVVSIYAYTLIKNGKLRSGGLAAIAAGAGMVATLHWIPGIVTIIGGVLCYNSSKEPYPRLEDEPQPSNEVWVP
jgi:hypothetical protein